MASYNFDRACNYKTPNGKYWYEVCVSTTELYGYFEHSELGDERGGGLWFNSAGELIDQDGLAYLPNTVADALRAMGFIVGQEYDN